MLSIDETKDISNLAIGDAKEEYAVARAVGILQVYESEWERLPKDKPDIATRSAEKLPPIFSG